MVKSINLPFAPLDRIQEIDDAIDADKSTVYDPWFDERTMQLLDELNDCTDAGGHIYLAHDGDVWCIHCGARAS